MKKTLLLLPLTITSLSLAASIPPVKFQALHQSISDATNNLENILFDKTSGIIAHSKQNKPTKAKLETSEQTFQDNKIELERTLYTFLDQLATTEPSKNFPTDWSFDLPDYPDIEEQPVLQQEYENLMNAFHSVINKERYIAHFFKLWLTDNYESEVIALFYTIGQDLVARSLDDVTHAYYEYVYAMKEVYNIK